MPDKEDARTCAANMECITRLCIRLLGHQQTELVLFVCFLLLVVVHFVCVVTGPLSSGQYVVNVAPSVARELLRTSDVRTIHSARVNSLRTRCQTRNATRNLASPRSAIQGVALHERRLYYCRIPTPGAATWGSIDKNERNMSQFIFNSGSIHSGAWAAIQTNSFHFVRTYRKFVFVRNPYERLFSAFMDRMFVVPMNQFDGVLKSEQRNGVTCTKQLTFTDAVKYVIESKVRNFTDVHFRLQHELCPPCEMGFDFIGKFETYVQDMEYILRKFDINLLTDKMKTTVNASESSAIEDIVHYIYKYAEQNNTRCVTTIEYYQKLWSSLQAQGLIAFDEPFSFHHEEGLSKEAVLSLVRKTCTSHLQKHPNARSQQQHVAYIEAYRTVPLTYLRKLRDVFRDDCELFGYDVEPSEIFNRPVPMSRDHSTHRGSIPINSTNSSHSNSSHSNNSHTNSSHINSSSSSSNTKPVL